MRSICAQLHLSRRLPLLNCSCLPHQVGDHKQLPATVLSQQAAAKGYGRSMFARLQARGYPCSMLAVQYR